MVDEIVYMSGIVAAGFAVNYLLRALPFLIFSGRDRALPVWVERLGRIISPVIIAGLIVYSYSGLEWKTAWPYLAGAVTVGIHLWRRNPLVSIIAGTALYMCLVNCGCVTTTTLEMSRNDPPIRISRNGILFQDRFVTPQEVPRLLEKHRVPKDSTIYVLVDDDYDDQRALWVFKNNYLSHNGYTRSTWVHRRRAVSGKADEVPHDAKPVKIPYEGSRFRPPKRR